MSVDAKAEAEKRYPALHADDEELTYPRSRTTTRRGGPDVKL